jgi:outer membrane murein-binding lipoprotein Lpp
MMRSLTRPTGMADDVKGAWHNVREWAATFAPWALIAWWVVVWLTGGLHPQTQVQYEQLSNQVATLQTTLSALSSKLDAMPRPSDYAAQDAHLSRIDNQLTALGDRLTADEIRSSAADARTQRLIDGTATTTRQPR